MFFALRFPPCFTSWFARCRRNTRHQVFASHPRHVELNLDKSNLRVPANYRGTGCARWIPCGSDYHRSSRQLSLFTIHGQARW